eukprot:9869726-Alexandrium_andersonii.AAC.1
MRAFLASRVHFFRAAGPNARDWASHRRAAHETPAQEWITMGPTMPPAELDAARRRLDTRWMPMSWDVRLPEDPDATAAALVQSLAATWP